MKLKNRITKSRIILAAVVIGAALSLMTGLFVGGVSEQLWQQSISTIMEATQQGCNTLRVQLQNEYESLWFVVEYLESVESGEIEALDSLLEDYGHIDGGVSFYLEDGGVIPSGSQADEYAVKQLAESGQEYGILDPHISSVTGVNVFQLFIRVTLKDGVVGFLLKEYEVGNIVDSFSLSFYQGTGFSYVVDGDGNVLIRPPHPGSNKTVRNLFDMLEVPQNEPKHLQQFAKALADKQTGWASFSYEEENTIFCYIPLGLGSDWYLVSIIPRAVVRAQTNQIIRRALGLIAAILCGLVFLIALNYLYAKRTNRKMKSQAEYIGHLYNAVPEGIALISVEQPYRFLQLNQEGLRLLDYPEETSNDVLRNQFLQDVIPGEDYERLTEAFLDTAECGRKNVFENRVIKKDGSMFWASGLVEKTLDENGNPILITTFHDITDEKLAKEEEEREKLQERRMLVSAVSNIYPVIVSLNLTRDTYKFLYAGEGLLVEMKETASYSGLYEEGAE